MNNFYVTPEIDFDKNSVMKFNAVMSRYVTELNMSMGDVMAKAARTMATALAMETPPYVDKAASNNLDAKKRGESAVKQDLVRAITPASQMFKTEFKNKTLNKYIKKKDYESFNKAIEKMPKLSKWKAVPFDPSYHTKARVGGTQGRYRVSGFKHFITFDESKWKAYLKQLQTTVGYLKAGWMKTAVAFEGKCPDWIFRSVNFSKGFVETNLHLSGEKKYILFGNTTPTVARFSGRYNYTIEETTKKMMSDIRIKLDYIAKQAKGG